MLGESSALVLTVGWNSFVTRAGVEGEVELIWCFLSQHGGNGGWEVNGEREWLECITRRGTSGESISQAEGRLEEE